MISHAAVKPTAADRILWYSNSICSQNHNLPGYRRKRSVVGVQVGRKYDAMLKRRKSTCLMHSSHSIKPLWRLPGGAAYVLTEISGLGRHLFGLALRCMKRPQYYNKSQYWTARNALDEREVDWWVANEDTSVNRRQDLTVDWPLVGRQNVICLWNTRRTFF